ncbi:MAG TPA: mechanosensitive ion channel family protein [Gemmataceae bacterium]|jgi:small conductance mechanosensitive channel|nr:mechanosensitive ion channel family protein [Gemmataceae bacterium]
MSSLPLAVLWFSSQSAEDAGAKPLAPIWQWLLEHGTRIIIAVAAMVIGLWLLRILSRRIVRVISGHSLRGHPEERENRANTLASVFRNSVAFAIWAAGILMILQGLDIPIIPLLGSAAILGLAVAFGAQNLIRDFFTGFMILLEDQYAIGDFVKIGDVSGQVESITLRRTVVRDVKGTAHFIPHGSITVVSNMTHGGSRAYFEIAVSYKEDPDRAMAELLKLCEELRADAEFAPLILDKAEMLGVDQFGGRGFVITFFMRTAPLKQWVVQRELLRRIKKRFDELKIELGH